MKFYIDDTGLARATFFKAKKELIEIGVIEVDAFGRLDIDIAASRAFLSEKYPGLFELK